MAPTARKAAKEKMLTMSAGNKSTCARGGPRGQAGVTLLELVVVVTILALVATLAGPPIARWLDDWQLRTAAERLAQTIRYARTRAVFEQRYYLVELGPGTNRLRVLEPESEFLREVGLPAEVRWQEENEAIATEPLRLILSPSGLVEEKTFWLLNARGTRVKVHVGFLVGGPEVEVTEEGS